MTTTFDALLSRIKVLVTEGAGSDSRTIPANTFQSEEIIGGTARPADEKARNIAWKPEFTLTSWQLVDKDRINENFTACIYDINLSFEVSYKAAPPVWEAERLVVEQTMMNNCHIIRRALCNPDNFDADLTGLASGCLEFQSAGSSKYDYSKGIVSVPLSFSGFVQLDFV